MQANTRTPTPGPDTSPWVPQTPEDELAVAFFRAMRQFKSLLGADAVNVVCLGAIVRNGPMRVSCLAADLGLDISTASRHVSNLEAAALLTREGDPADRRATLLTLTAAGRTYFDDCMQRRSQALHAATQGWPDADRATLTTLINRLADDLSTVIENGEVS